MCNTCENAVFFSNVALLAMRALIISLPLAPCLHESYRIFFFTIESQKHCKEKITSQFISAKQVRRAVEFT